MTRTFTTDMLNDPFFIGFDRMLDRMKATTPGQTNYPPYNIIKKEEHLYELQLAVAGFAQDDIKIEVKDGTLTIEGKKSADDEVANYVHKGISSRAFRRMFTLSDTMVVNGADMTDGILTIALENVIPEEKKPRIIEIGNRQPELLNG